MSLPPPRASGLALLAAGIGLLLGGAALWLGLEQGSVAQWGLGAACLLQVPPSLSLWRRLREGLGNRGLEGERLTLRAVSHLLSLLALGLALTSVAALLADRSPQAEPFALPLALVAVGCQAALWVAKRGLAGIHPTLDLDASRTRTLLELAALLLAATLLGRAFPWADAVVGLVMALRLFLEGRTLAKGTALPAVSGGCGGGCC